MNTFKQWLLESTIFDYKKTYNLDDTLEYKFNAEDLKYFVNIWHDDRKHHIGEWEVEFGVKDQKDQSHRTGKDLKHLNSVLNTVFEIVEKEVKDKKIARVKIEGAGGENEMGIFQTTTRSRLYLRFLKRKFPSDSISSGARYIKIDCMKAFPELFEDKESKVDKIVNVLVQLSDNDPDAEGIHKGISGKDDTQFNINTDFIENKEKGNIYVDITVSDPMKEYNIEWESDEDSGEESFSSFEDLLTYIKSL